MSVVAVAAEPGKYFHGSLQVRWHSHFSFSPFLWVCACTGGSLQWVKSCLQGAFPTERVNFIIVPVSTILDACLLLHLADSVFSIDDCKSKSSV